VAGGREVTLRSLTPLALYPANSIFSNGYLTTPGAPADQDLVMIRDAGFELLVAGYEGGAPAEPARPRLSLPVA
jgi:biotin synthase